MRVIIISILFFSQQKPADIGIASSLLVQGFQNLKINNNAIFQKQTLLSLIYVGIIWNILISSILLVILVSIWQNKIHLQTQTHTTYNFPFHIILVFGNIRQLDRSRWEWFFDTKKSSCSLVLEQVGKLNIGNTWENSGA